MRQKLITLSRHQNCIGVTHAADVRQIDAIFHADELVERSQSLLAIVE